MDDQPLVLDREVFEELEAMTNDVFGKVVIEPSLPQQIVNVVTSFLRKRGHAVEDQQAIFTQHPHLAGTGRQCQLTVGIWCSTLVLDGPWYIRIQGG